MTELVFLLDCSGSMAGLESDTIGGYNSFLKKQRDIEGECLVTTVLFNNDTKIVHDRVNLKELADLTDKEYYVGGSTALLDALGNLIDRISLIQSHVRPEDCPNKTIFVITTDGMENSSHIYTSSKVKQMVHEKEISKAWEFIFMGANIDAVSEARRYGIRADHAVNYLQTNEGITDSFLAASDAVMFARTTGVVGKNWADAITKKNKKK